MGLEALSVVQTWQNTWVVPVSQLWHSLGVWMAPPPDLSIHNMVELVLVCGRALQKHPRDLSMCMSVTKEGILEGVGRT